MTAPDPDAQGFRPARTTGRELAEMPPGVTDISEVYDLVRNYLDGTSDDLRAYEALDYLYVHAQSWLQGAPWDYAAPR